jgi:NADPH:quinone reductase-like Zn-dependent oxidoreductase
MNAIVCTRYGSPKVLQLREVAKPTPQDGEVLIRIHAASINARDWRLLRAKPFFVRLMPGGLLRPRNAILGADLAGRIEAVGSHITRFRPGDEVFGCLPSSTGRGTFAEYVCAEEHLIAPKPANVTFEQAAAVPLAAMTALQGLRDSGRIQVGQKVLINGASGGVGTFAVQIAKVLGAEVTAVCSTRNVDMVRSLGADHVVDYRKEDSTGGGQRYDLILAVNGYHPMSDYLRALRSGGRCVVVGGSMLQLIQAASNRQQTPGTGDPIVVVLSLVQRQKDLVQIEEFLESGKIRAVVDAVYPLSKTAEAFWYFENEHPRGKTVISMEDGDT